MRAGARALSVQDQAFDDEVKAAMISQKNTTFSVEDPVGKGKYSDASILGIATRGTSNGRMVSEAERMAAVKRVLDTGSSDERRAVYASSSSASASVRKTMSDGFFAKGDQKYYGAGTGSVIQNGGIKSTEDLDTAMAKRINSEGISAESLVQDTFLTGHVERVSSAGGTESQKISSEALKDLALNAANASNDEATRSKVTFGLKGPLSKISEVAQGQTETAPRATLQDFENAESAELDRRKGQL